MCVRINEQIREKGLPDGVSLANRSREEVPFLPSTPDHLLLDRSPNIGPLISRWELDIFKNC